MYIERTTLDGEELMYAIQDISQLDLYIMVSALEVLAFRVESHHLAEIQKIIKILTMEEK